MNRPVALESGRKHKAASSIRARKLLQVRVSLSHYWQELSRCRNPSDVFEWLYYKIPTIFPLRVYPSVVNIEITNNCNFQCPHCPRNALNEGRGLGFMELSTFKKITEEISGRVALVKLIGLGEPSLHPQLDAIMALLRDSGLKALIYTNGTLFERFKPDQVFSWGADEVVVSIDGVDARSFERLRLGGNFEVLRARLSEFRSRRDQLKQAGPRIEVRHVIMPNETPAMLQRFARFWRETVADTVKYCFLGEPYNKAREAARRRPSCRDIRREMHVRYDGRVPLCGYEGHGEWIGDLRKSSVQQVWRSTRLNEVRKRHARGDLSELDFCKTCQFW